MPRPPSRPRPAPQKADGPTHDARLRAATRIAAARGFLAGFPNFHFGNTQGGVSGHIFLSGDVAEWSDVRADFLGFPRLTNLPQLFVAAHGFATIHGFATALPNGNQASYVGTGQLFGVTLIKPRKAIVTSVPSARLGGVPAGDVPGMFRAVADFAAANGFAGGFPTFLSSAGGMGGNGTMRTIALFPRGSVTWQDVRLADLQF